MFSAPQLVCPDSATKAGLAIPGASNFFPSTAENASGGGRKRRFAGGLPRIAVHMFAADKLDSSESPLDLGASQSLTGDDRNGGQRARSPLGNKDCPSTGTLDGLEHLKRFRLSSSQSNNGLQLNSSGDGSPTPAIDDSAHHRQTPPTLSEQLECVEQSDGGGSTSPNGAQQLSSGGLLLTDNRLGVQFELVGDGRNCKAVDTRSQTVRHCQIMKLAEFKLFSEIMARIQSASGHYSKKEFEVRSGLLLPLEHLLVLRCPERKNLVYVLLPDHFGTLHQLMEDNELAFPDQERACLSERRVQPILKQIAALLEFCHRIGLFFRDFRFRKFVFIDADKTRIRVNNVLDLCMAPNTLCDRMASREFIPAFVAPEVLDKKNQLYAGKAADLWAFGVLIFTLLNGRYPFFESSPSPIALFRRIRAHRFSAPMGDWISEQARWLIHSLLRPEPKARPTAAQLLDAHWFRAELYTLLDRSEKPDNQRGSDWDARGRRTKLTSAALSSSPLILLTPAVPIVPGRTSPLAAQVPIVVRHHLQQQRARNEDRGTQTQLPLLTSRTLSALLLDEPMSSMNRVGGAALTRQQVLSHAENGRRRQQQRTASESRDLNANRVFADMGTRHQHSRAPAFAPLNLWLAQRRGGALAMLASPPQNRRILLINSTAIGGEMHHRARQQHTLTTNNRITKHRELVVPLSESDQVVPELGVIN